LDKIPQDGKLFIIFLRHVTNKMATHFLNGIISKSNVNCKEVYPNLPDTKILVQVSLTFRSF